jgi:excisionase family DNA binding protein
MTQDVNVDYISSPEAARILQITYVGVAQLARQGKIPAVKIANRWLIPRAFVEEFAQTYEGKRGRPRKKGPSAGFPETLATTQTDGLALANTGSAVMGFGTADDAAPAFGTQVDQQEGIPVFTARLGELPPEHAAAELEAKAFTPEDSTALTMDSQLEPAEGPPASPAQMAQPGLEDVRALSEARDTGDEAGEVLAVNAGVVHTEQPPASAALPGELELRDAGAVSETEDSKKEGDETFAVSAEIFHLDKNYDFELYEKGEITERARLIVARLKPKIPSLPQFSFRWDYRYEHLNVDIHGVEPAAMDWWTLGENGYTGHLPRRLGGPGYAFEAVIWLPVTFVFRGRLTLSLRDSPAAGEGSSSVATTTGGLRKLWTRWPTIRHST